jgi:putative N6-adenine-specific DNA methylase
MPKQFNMVAKTLSGLEALLAEELRELGADDIRPFNRLITFKGDKRLLYKVNFRCRTAIRILVRIKKFNVTDEKHLYDEIKAIDWARYLDKDGTLAIDPVVTNSTFTHSQYVAQLAKDAIVDQFRESTGVRPSVDLKDPDLRLNLHMNQNITTIYLDSSGDSLHKRGYRTQTNVAPINEVLAAGIIQLTQWDRRTPFIDGMCGSGTFVIEAALLAQNIAPGFFRKQFGFERWKDYDPDLYRDVCVEAEGLETRSLPFKIVGSDIDPQTVQIALQNVKNAGLEETVTIECKSFEEQRPPTAPGLLLMNPPYGERIEIRRTREFHKMIGDVLKKKYAGYAAFIFTGNPEAVDSIGLQPVRKTPLFNGAIDCLLLEFRMKRRKARGPESI